MDEFFNQVAWTASAGAYFLALAGALVIPDMCAALESPDGATNGPRYKAWFDKNIAPLHVSSWSNGPILDGETCWRFRCSLLHQGTTQHPESRYKRVLFVEPGASTNVFHMNVLNDALNIDVREFCMDMVRAALAWREPLVGTEPYETNLTKFVTRYPDGLPPYIGGIPVIS